jgi:hypothetical protein
MQASHPTHLLRLATVLWCLFISGGNLPAAESVSLQLNPASAHHAEVRVLADGSLSILTTGGDPFMATHPLADDASPADAVVLEFEYFCPDGLDHFEVFFGPPIRAGASAKSGPLPPAELWRSATVNLSALSKGGWTGHARQFRLDFGSKPGVTLQLRNLHLRQLTPDEIAESRIARERSERKGREAAAIRTYLKRAFSARIESVRCEDNWIVIDGHSPGEEGEELQLAELQMHEEPWREGQRPNTVSFKPGAGGAFHLVLARHADGRDRLFSRWQLVRRNNNGESLLSHARHATELPTPPTTAPPQPQTRKTKKGMGGVTLNPIAGELQEMGVEHVTINIVLNRFFRTVPGPTTTPYEFEGRSYPMDKNALEDMDKTLSFFSRFATVSAILLVATPQNGRERSPLAHPESGPPGIYAMPDLTTPGGVQAYRAVLAFLAERYAGGPHGRITHWILHNEIDQAFSWTNMGEQPMDLVMDHYVRSMRLAFLSARRFQPSAKVFISLTHHWTAPEGESLQHYRPREMLDRLADYSRVEGDFEWGIAYHPYPQSLFEAATWNDKRPEHSFDTPYITLKNIEVLDAYLHREPLLFEGKTPRTVLLSEQGFHTRDYSPFAQQLQAAALVYTWHKIKHLPTIEAFHNHRWIDAKNEGGLLLGVRTLPEPNKPFGERKAAWAVYRDLDTPDEAATTDFAKEIIGVQDFTQIPYRGRIQTQRKEP